MTAREAYMHVAEAHYAAQWLACSRGKTVAQIVDSPEYDEAVPLFAFLHVDTLEAIEAAKDGVERNPKTVDERREKAEEVFEMLGVPVDVLYGLVQ